jgi:fructosamine-3-kinase
MDGKRAGAGRQDRWLCRSGDLLGAPEIELAFTTMFGTFGETFFEAYEALLPLEPGFYELRSALYKLYPTLVHVRLFGSAYLPPIEQTLKRVGL